MKNNYQITSLVIFVLTTISLLVSYLLKTSGMTLIGISLIGYLLVIIFLLLSKENKKTNKNLFFIFLVLILLGILFGTIDYYRAISSKSPLFAIPLIVYKDGGSKEYFGLGYKVIKCNNLNGDKSVNIGFYNLDIGTTCISSTEIYSLYLKVIDNIMNINNYNQSEYLALDLNTFEFLDLYYQNILLEYAKKYNNKVIKSTYKELVKNGYADDAGQNLKGYLISIKDFKKENNKVIFEIGRYKESLGARGFCYKATYNNSGWKIKETCNWIS